MFLYDNDKNQNRKHLSMQNYLLWHFEINVSEGRNKTKAEQVLKIVFDCSNASLPNQFYSRSIQYKMNL